MAFIKFKNYAAAARCNITLRFNQYLFISNSILQRMKWEGFYFAEFFTDIEAKLIGVKLIYKNEDAFHRKVFKEKNGVSIHIRPILKAFELQDFHKTTTFEIDEKDDMIVFSLIGLKK